jgi:hypothetical protein
MDLANFNPAASSLLVQMTEYEVEVELLHHHGDMMMQMVHGNKHLTAAQLVETRERSM